MTVTEAGACGTPSVATRIGGHEDAVVDGTSGILVDGTDDMVAALDAVLRDEVLRRRLGVGALDHAGRLTWDATARGTLAALGSRGAGPPERLIGHVCPGTSGDGSGSPLVDQAGGDLGRPLCPSVRRRPGRASLASAVGGPGGRRRPHRPAPRKTTPAQAHWLAVPNDWGQAPLSGHPELALVDGHVDPGGGHAADRSQRQHEPQAGDQQHQEGGRGHRQPGSGVAMAAADRPAATAVTTATATDARGPSDPERELELRALVERPRPPSASPSVGDVIVGGSAVAPACMAAAPAAPPDRPEASTRQPTRATRRHQQRPVDRLWGAHVNVTSSLPSCTYGATAAGSIRQPLAKASISTGCAESVAAARPWPSTPG